MAKFTEKLSSKEIDFINEQKMFFVSTAPKNGKINISPKGLDNTFKILNEDTILWLNYFGSGNETAAHLLEDNRMTIMFCALQGDANILRLYCEAKCIQEKDDDWSEYINHFPISRAARQVFEVKIKSVNNSCGMGVPLYDFVGQRDELNDFYDNSTKEEHLAYMRRKNLISFDGKDTKLFD
ncbi:MULTISPECIES: pyridoxamine 5'-phosphate oxidase family protein [Arcobacteraceae]|uniref:Pyridoxamine 5'-phosphate oxidase n=1 Tax=Poseidonibacter parvus TaxID=1850254 RepID=A0A1P8KL83_9BACT|nr:MULTISPECIES: pyridoxamine 5'-phosphate oxidase family protein [Arcobacteraceae]APW65318.1 pyridoxamine 5'-phosphate oxidase [Poseidonibacter parvus]